MSRDSPTGDGTHTRGPTCRRRGLLGTLGTAAAVGLAGCGGGETGTVTLTSGEAVPAVYETATSIGGTRRDPDALSTKPAVNYQPQPNEGQRCSGCRYYVEDENGDGAGACAVVAGAIAPDAWCVSYAPYEGTATDAEAATGDGPGGEATATGTDGAAVAPASVPPAASCPVCGMAPADYPDWNAQLVHEDGERAFFDTTGCLATFVALPETFASTDAAVAGVWVTEFGTGERIDGTTAHYALETDTDRVDDPMGRNPAAFAARADAVAYVDAVDYLTTDDVVGIEAFDREVATRYRETVVESARGAVDQPRLAPPTRP